MQQPTKQPPQFSQPSVQQQQPQIQQQQQQPQIQPQYYLPQQQQPQQPQIQQQQFQSQPQYYLPQQQQPYVASIAPQPFNIQNRVYAPTVAQNQPCTSRCWYQEPLRVFGVILLVLSIQDMVTSIASFISLANLPYNYYPFTTSQIILDSADFSLWSLIAAILAMGRHSSSSRCTAINILIIIDMVFFAIRFIILLVNEGYYLGWLYLLFRLVGAYCIWIIGISISRRKRQQIVSSLIEYQPLIIAPPQV